MVYDASGIVSGGTVIAVGVNGMAQNFGNASTQGSIMLSVGNQSGIVTITDAGGGFRG